MYYFALGGFCSWFWLGSDPSNPSSLLGRGSSGIGDGPSVLGSSFSFLPLKSVIVKPKEKLNTNDGEPEPKVHWAALTGFITSLVGIFVSPILLGILSIICGYRHICTYS